MDDIKRDPFEEYIRQSEPDKRELGYAWYTAMGLQAVDGLETSDYLKKTAKKNIEGEITILEAGKLIESFLPFPYRSISESTEGYFKVFILMQEKSEIITFLRKSGCLTVHLFIMGMH